jgi:hypothetical protein
VIPQRIDRAFGSLSQKRFELGKDLFDGIRPKIRTLVNSSDPD